MECQIFYTDIGKIGEHILHHQHENPSSVFGIKDTSKSRVRRGSIGQHCISNTSVHVHACS